MTINARAEQHAPEAQRERKIKANTKKEEQDTRGACSGRTKQRGERDEGPTRHPRHVHGHGHALSWHPVE